MFFISFYRASKFALQDFFRNFWLSLITISIVVLTLLSINVLTIIQILTKQAVSEVEEKIDLTINFAPSAPQTDIEKIKKFVKEQPETLSLEYLPAEEVLEDFKKKHEDDKTIQDVLNQLEENPLGSVMIVKARNIEDYNALIEKLEHGGEEIPTQNILTKNFRDYRDITTRIHALTERFTEVGYGISMVFLIITVLIMFNTIRVGIYTHREEINVMKLVGASNMFIRAPFLIEAIWLSVLAFVVSLLIWFPVLGVLEPYFNDFFSSFELVTFILDNTLTIFGYQFAILLLINILSSAVALRRYLKV